MQINTKQIENSNSLFETMGQMFNPKPVKQLIDVVDYHISEDCDVDIEATWGVEPIQINVPNKIVKDWANHTGKLTSYGLDGESRDIDFEGWMIVDFNFTEALELAKYVIKHHFVLITKAV